MVLVTLMILIVRLVLVDVPFLREARCANTPEKEPRKKHPGWVCWGAINYRVGQNSKSESTELRDAWT